jgi:hypothetical protein
MERAMIDANGLPDWDDPRVQLVYKILCDPDLDTPPNREEHWEGWIARNIVAALSSFSSSPRDTETKS